MTRRKIARLLLGTLALLLLLPCLGLMGSAAALRARQAGAFSRWRSLGAPAGGAMDILTGDVEVVYVSTPGGAIYGCDHSERTASCWEPAQEPLAVDSSTFFDRRVLDREARPPPGTVVDTLETSVWYADAAFEARYALLDDGTVWVWQYDVSGYMGLFLWVLGPAAGLLLAIPAAVWLWLRAPRVKSKE